MPRRSTIKKVEAPIAAPPQPVPQPMAMPAMVQPPQVAAPAPATVNASQFGITASVQEILITLGHSRVPIDPATAQPQGHGREWLMTVSLSPTSAKQLVEALAAGLAQYEKTFGKIPMDANAQKQIAEQIQKNWKLALASQAVKPKRSKPH